MQVERRRRDGNRFRERDAKMGLYPRRTLSGASRGDRILTVPAAAFYPNTRA
jgi:hypothetical protein